MYQGMPMPREDHFTAICAFGNSNIALLMVKTGSIPGGVDAKVSERRNTPLFTAPALGLQEVVAALIEAGADINGQGNMG